MAISEMVILIYLNGTLGIILGYRRLKKHVIFNNTTLYGYRRLVAKKFTKSRNSQLNSVVDNAMHPSQSAYT
jgi:hypothetical protein